MPSSGQSIDVNVTVLNLPARNYSVWFLVLASNPTNGAYDLSSRINVVYFTLSLVQVLVYHNSSGSVCSASLTTTMYPAGSPILAIANSDSVVGGQPIISQTYFDDFPISCGSHITLYMWVSVQNSTYQTSGVFIGSVTASATTAQQNFSVSAVLFNLLPSTYAATFWLTTSVGVALSTSRSISFELQ